MGRIAGVRLGRRNCLPKWCERQMLQSYPSIAANKSKNAQVRRFVANGRTRVARRAIIQLVARCASFTLRKLNSLAFYPISCFIRFTLKLCHCRRLSKEVNGFVESAPRCRGNSLWFAQEQQVDDRGAYSSVSAFLLIKPEFSCATSSLS